MGRRPPSNRHRLRPWWTLRKGNRRKSWNDYSDAELWEYIVKAGNIVDIGLKAPDQATGMKDGQFLLSRAEWDEATRSVISTPSVQLVSADTLLPIIRVKITDVKSAVALRRSPRVDYVEPGYFVDTPKGVFWNDLLSGCQGSKWDKAVEYITPGDILPWNSRKQWVHEAWRLSDGSGVTVGIVDTGVDDQQTQLNGEFTAGWSSGREIVKKWTSGGGWDDQCGHGTRMAGIIAAPRDGKNIVGIAWKANLLSVTSDDDVVLDAASVSDIRYGIREAATGASIINMAFGTMTAYSSISDEIRYWYNNYDRLFIGAAGTSAELTDQMGVVFPAWISEVVAVTGVDSKGVICGNCHWGPEPEVVFSAYVDQPTTGLVSSHGDIASIGGSSNASAVVSGIAALIWSRYPTVSRDWVIARMKYTNETGTKNSDTGYGNVNAYGAIGGLYKVAIQGPAKVQPGAEYTYTAKQSNSPSVSYLWHTGETTQSITIRMPHDQVMYDLWVEVTDPQGIMVRDEMSVRIEEDTSCMECVN
jgi:serine protease